MDSPSNDRLRELIAWHESTAVHERKMGRTINAERHTEAACALGELLGFRERLAEIVGDQETTP